MTVVSQQTRRIRLAEAAQRYYLDGESQDEVAAALGTSRSNISRMLEAARREGVVRFIVDHPLQRHRALESAMADLFDIADVRIVAHADDTLDLVGRLGAFALEEHLPTMQRLAIGWGRTVEAVIDRVAIASPADVEVVQVGGDLTMAPAPSGHELVRRLADALGGRNRFLHAPALLESETAAAQLLSDARIAAELDLARGADTALVGIGLPGVGFAESALSRLHPGADEAAAVVCARLVDTMGIELDTPLRDRVIAIELDALRRIPHVIGVAAGAAKGQAIAAALRGNLVDTLVCDQPAAAAALDQANPTKES